MIDRQTTNVPALLRKDGYWPIIHKKEGLMTDPILAILAEYRRRQLEIEQTREHLRAYVDNPELFFDRYLLIDDPQAPTGTVPFVLWEAQRDVLRQITQHRLIVILKSRQLGISWLVCGYALWLCLFHPGRVVLLFSQGQTEADELLRRISSMYYRLPEAVRNALPRALVVNTSKMAWGNGSRVLSLPATKKAGRTFTASLVVMDEAAHMEYAEDLFVATKPTIDGGGQLIMISTARGTGNLFHQVWTDAQAGTNRFVPLFLPWSARPGRDDTWYAQRVAEYRDLRLVHQEYPATPEEAFEATTLDRFLPSISWWDLCYRELPPLGREPLVLAVDAAVGRRDSPSDCFAIVGVTRSPFDRNSVAVRFVQSWQARPGEKIQFQSPDGTGPEDVIRALCRRYSVVCLVYDPYQLADMTGRLEREGVVWCLEFPQGAKRLEADRLLYDLILEQRLHHTGDRDIREHIDNADRKLAENGALRLVQGARGKIDLAVALSMAAYTCLETLNL